MAEFAEDCVARADFDASTAYVRVTGLRSDGFVEFDFAIGEPEIFVELILPAAAFEDFCRHNSVTTLAPEVERASEAHPFDWRLADATGRRAR